MGAGTPRAQRECWVSGAGVTGSWVLPDVCSGNSLRAASALTCWVSLHFSPPLFWDEVWKPKLASDSKRVAEFWFFPSPGILGVLVTANLCNARDPTKGFMYARQTANWATPTAFFFGQSLTLTSKSQCFCLRFPRVRITSLQHHTTLVINFFSHFPITYPDLNCLICFSTGMSLLVFSGFCL